MVVVGGSSRDDDGRDDDGNPENRSPGAEQNTTIFFKKIIWYRTNGVPHSGQISAPISAPEAHPFGQTLPFVHCSQAVSLLFVTPIVRLRSSARSGATKGETMWRT